MKKEFIIYACSILGNTTSGLTGGEIGKYFVEYSMRFKKSIPFADGNFNKDGKLLNKKDALKENLLAFSGEEQFYILDDLCKKLKFFHNADVKALRIRLHKDYADLNTIGNESEELNMELVNETKHWLRDFSAVLKQYDAAVSKYQLHSFERNVLDDFRLTLESLLRELLQNTKSLENQLPDIGILVKGKGGSPEYTNMFSKLIEYYAKYQNNYVKHNDRVNALEVEFVIEMTAVFMKNLVRLSKA